MAVQNGPARKRVRSRTRTPLSADITPPPTPGGSSSEIWHEVPQRGEERLEVRVVGELPIERRVRAADEALVLLSGGNRQGLLELLEQRLGLQLRLDRDLLRQRDQETAALDQPADDVLVAALDHA